MSESNDFDLTNVFTSVNADILKQGDKVLVADSLKQLKHKVSCGFPSEELLLVYGEEQPGRFLTDEGAFILAYLIDKR